MNALAKFLAFVVVPFVLIARAVRRLHADEPIDVIGAEADGRSTAGHVVFRGRAYVTTMTVPSWYDTETLRAVSPRMVKRLNEAVYATIAARAANGGGR